MSLWGIRGAPGGRIEGDDVVEHEAQDVAHREGERALGAVARGALAGDRIQGGIFTENSVLNYVFGRAEWKSKLGHVEWN